MDQNIVDNNQNVNPKNKLWMLPVVCLSLLNIVILGILILVMFNINFGEPSAAPGMFLMLVSFIVFIINGIITGKVSRIYGLSFRQLIFGVFIGSIVIGAAIHIFFRITGESSPIYDLGNILFQLLTLFWAFIFCGISSSITFFRPINNNRYLSEKTSLKIRLITGIFMIAIVLPFIADNIWGVTTLFNKNSAVAYCTSFGGHIKYCDEELFRRFAKKFKSVDECVSFIWPDFGWRKLESDARIQCISSMEGDVTIVEEISF